MATIYRAWDQVLERDVAVKVLHPHLADDRALLQRFKAEARSAARLAHPHAVNVFDEGVADLPFMVLEYVDGPSLRDVLQVRGKLPPREALAVVEPMCSALARAHATGLVHRDVKPENVLVSSTDGTVKVADFGIARVLASTRVTDSGVVLGSIHYLGPEVILGSEASPASDQYAVGLVLFEVLTGQKPLPARNAAAVALRHTRETIPAASDFVPGIPTAVDDVLAKATALDPADRYATLTAFLAALREAIPGGPQPVVVPGRDASKTLVIPKPDVPDDPEEEPGAGEAAAQRRRRSSPWSHRHVVPVLAAVATVAALLAGTILTGGSGLPLIGLGQGEVPAVAQLSVAEATALIERAGLAVEVGEEVAHPTVAAGDVIDSDPPAGTPVEDGTVVTLRVSSGPAVPMPAVEGRPSEEVVGELEEDPYRFVVQVEQRFTTAGVPAGVVEAQNPAAGVPLPAGSTISLVVSLGPEQVEVPNLSGLTRQEAEQQLAELGFEAVLAEEFSDQQPEVGRVVRQDPAAGSLTDIGAGVQVVVSGGPATIEIPDLWLQPLADARERLQTLGLPTRVVEEPQPRIGPFAWGLPGLVERQEPAAGDRVPRGTEIVLFTWSEPVDDAGSDGDEGSGENPEQDGDGEGNEESQEQGQSADR